MRAPRGLRWETLDGSLPPLQHGDAKDILWLEYQAIFRHYSDGAARNKAWYLILKLLTLSAGASGAILAALAAPAAVTASVTACAVLSESIQQLFKFHDNWLNYRSTAEQLRIDGYLYAAASPPFDTTGCRQMLADKMQKAASTQFQVWQKSMSTQLPLASD
ncbi:MAG: DUF4231 domain-containing protein [Actinomycetales bacterium]